MTPEVLVLRDLFRRSQLSQRALSEILGLQQPNMCGVLAGRFQLSLPQTMKLVRLSNGRVRPLDLPMSPRAKKDYAALCELGAFAGQFR